MSFEGLIGQRAARDFFSRSLGAGRLAHAYLFSGPPGVGKMTFARRLAQALLCRADPPGCGDCSACRRVANGQHPDWHPVTTDEGKRFISIQAVRVLRDQLRLAPLEGMRRVAALDPAEALTEEAANSLLKILEEPPAGVVLLLVTGEPGRLPDTVVSRCQRVRFSGLTDAEVSRGLVAAGVPAAEAAALVPLAAGSIGQGLAAWSQREERDRRRELVARIFRPEADEPSLPLADEIYQASREGTKVLEEARQRFLPLLELFTLAVRDRLVAGAGAAGARLLHPELAPAVAGATAHLGPDQLDRLAALAREARGQVWANANLQLVIECFLLAVRERLGRR